MGNLIEKDVSTSYIERANLTIRMHSRRFTRLTNGFSKKVENHAHAVALHFFAANFCRAHMTLTKAAGRDTHVPGDGGGAHGPCVDNGGNARDDEPGAAPAGAWGNPGEWRGVCIQAIVLPPVVGTDERLMVSHSTFLIAEPSFVSGMGRLGDLWGGYSYYSYNYSLTPAEADARAIRHDWLQVGDDMQAAMAQTRVSEQEA